MIDRTLLDDIESFIADYYKEELAELAQSYPKDSESLWIDYQDLYQALPDIADDLLTSPEQIKPHFPEAVDMVELPIDVDLSDANVRFYNLPDGQMTVPADLRNEHAGTFVGVKGTLAKATGISDRPTKLVFECTKGHEKEILQLGNERTEPQYCQQCDGRPNWDLLTHKGEWTDQMKIKVETPPDETGAIAGDSITGLVKDDLVEYGSDFGVAGRTGERVRVYGTIRREEKDGRGSSDLLFDQYIDVNGIEFVNDSGDVNPDKHKGQFTELAQSENPVDLWKASIAPELYATAEWDRAFELGVAYLFGAPRINVPEGPTYRGDIHMLIVSDYGMGKSTFTEGIKEYSPKCIKKSATGLASDVGLTASAVRDDDFGEGSWTLKPGILVKGNGGHVLLDEIDKGPDDLAKMNDALEGEQVVTVDKAGKEATFNSKVGLLATGNPEEGRFEKNIAVAPQIDVDSSLLSRFDGIVTMRDTADEETDANVSQRIGAAYREAQEVAFTDREEMDILERPVPVDVGRAWVKYARENINPQISKDQINQIKGWYAEDIRQINERMSDETDVDPPVPVTPRVVEDTIRIAVAFARVRLKEDVGDTDVERAKDLVKTLAGQTFDGEKFVNRQTKEYSADSQKERRNNIVQILKSDGRLEFAELQEATGLSESVLESDIDSLMQKGVICSPQNGSYRAT